MTASTEIDEGVEEARHVSKLWWLFLVTGVIWIVISFAVLSFDPNSAALIGLMMGAVLIVAGVNEFFAAAMVDGWKWAHTLLGVLFVVTGVMAMLEPFQTFGILALLIGWFLLIKGTVTVVFAVATRHELSLWGLLLAAGIAEIVIGIWALGYPGRSAWLLVLWVGIGALMRGITEIVTGFQLHSAHRRLA